MEELSENQNWYKDRAWPAWQGGVAEQQVSSPFLWQNALSSAQDVVLWGPFLNRDRGLFLTSGRLSRYKGFIGLVMDLKSTLRAT